MNMVTICPTRGRPQNALRLAQAFQDTDSNSLLVFAVDDDDPTLDEYRDTLTDCVQRPLQLAVNENRSRGGMVDALNAVAWGFSQDFDAICFMGDDHVPRTRRWDAIYLDHLEDLGTGIVYGNDLWQGEAMPTQVAMTSDIVRTLGWMAPPALEHLDVDVFWLELGRRLEKVRYLAGVVVEHVHPAAGKAPWDEHYDRVNNQGVIERDGAAYWEMIEKEMDGYVAAIREQCLAG